LPLGSWASAQWKSVTCIVLCANGSAPHVCSLCFL
jgi:hypothetical protein